MTASNKNLPTYLEKVSCLNNSFWWHVHNLHMKRLEAVCTFFRITRHILHCIFCVCCERLDWQNVIIFTFDVWVLVYHKLGCPVLAPFGTMLQCYVDMIFTKRLSAFFHIKTNKKTRIMVHRNHIFSSLFKNRFLYIT